MVFFHFFVIVLYIYIYLYNLWIFCSFYLFFFLIIIFPAKHEFQLLISLFFSFFRQIWCTKYHKFLITHVTNICIELGEQHFAESKSLPFFLERCYLIETIKNIRLPWLYILAIIWKLAIKHSHKKIYNISFSQTCNIFSFFLLSFAFSLPLPPSHFLSLSLSSITCQCQWERC